MFLLIELHVAVLLFWICSFVFLEEEPQILSVLALEDIALCFIPKMNLLDSIQVK